MRCSVMGKLISVVVERSMHVCRRHVHRRVRLITFNSQIIRLIHAGLPIRVIKRRFVTDDLALIDGQTAVGVPHAIQS